MGWNLSLYMRFADGADVWRSYLDLVEELGRLSDSFAVLEIVGFRDSPSPGPDFAVFSPKSGPDKVKDVRKLLHGLDQEQLILGSEIGLFRRDYEDGSPDGILKVWTTLLLRGPKASWDPTLEAERLNVIWRLEDSRYHDPRMNRSAAEENWNRLVDDVELLARMGVLAEIWCGEESFNGKPSSAYLTYQAEYPGTLAELDWLSGALDVRRINSGVLIYSKKGIEESLASLPAKHIAALEGLSQVGSNARERTDEAQGSMTQHRSLSADELEIDRDPEGKVARQVTRLLDVLWRPSMKWWGTIADALQLRLVESADVLKSYEFGGEKLRCDYEGEVLRRITLTLSEFVPKESQDNDEYEVVHSEYMHLFDRSVAAVVALKGAPTYRGQQGDEGFPDDEELVGCLARWRLVGAVLTVTYSNLGRGTPFRIEATFSPIDRGQIWSASMQWWTPLDLRRQA